MCGICGIYNFGNLKVKKKDLLAMSETLQHRGPDEQGIFIKNNIGLANNRLSIIDLKNGQQPITNEDGTVWIVFNGEIYNYLEIKEKLLKKGHFFKTQSDTEVIIHAYEEYGEKCVKLLNGMFAFAIWDSLNQRLFLARDRLGEKPLFYANTATSFLFASEIKAILTNREVKREVNLEALNIYLSLGYFLAPFSVIQGIFKLPSASILIIEKGRLKIKDYWNFDPTVKEKHKEADWIEKFKNLFDDSIKKRLIADVPVGAFLSGGIDSTSVVAGMVKQKVKPKTFSIGFAEKSYSELPYARQAANFLKTDHQDLIVKPNIQKVLDQIIWTNDEPFGDNSAIPMWFLSQMARKQVKVALSGDGSDESLAGYETFTADKIFNFYRQLPCQNLITSLVNQIPTSFEKVSFDYKLKQFVKASKFSCERAHFSWREYFSEEEKKELFLPDIYKQIAVHDTFKYFEPYFSRYQEGEFLDRASYVDIKTWLVDDILVKVDRTSMGNSLEVRTPFLDYRLVELLAKVPADLKLNGFKNKYLLKQAMTGIIPPKIINRRKEGFNAPVPYWLRDELKGFLEKYLSFENLQKLAIFNPMFVEKLINEYWQGKKDHSLKLWLLLNFVLWHKLYLE